MSLRDAFIGEIKHELSMTRKMLERVPLDKKDWMPHSKSMTVGRLATHIAENAKWVNRIIQASEFDFVNAPLKPHTASSTEELLQIFDENLENALVDLQNTSDDELNKHWAIKRGGVELAKYPKKAAIRGWFISHHIHHRGQLSVYLRLLDVPVPGMYGPSADEK